jgi:hypothetical protein
LTTHEELTGKEYSYDVFICHASEDKKEVAEPLATKLMAKNLKVWYDKFTLKVGDSLREKIDYGLSHSRYGIVILSPFFFKKNWPQRELDGLAAREDSEGHKVILPVWHNVDHEYVVKYSPTLAGRLASKTEEGLEVVLKQLMEVICENREPSRGRPIGTGLFVTRRKFIAGAIGTAVVVAAAGYAYLRTSQPNQIIQTTTTLLASETQNLVSNGGFEDGMSGWNMGTGATPSTAYVTSAIAHRGTSSLRLQSNEVVYQDLPPTSLLESMILSYFVYFESDAKLIPSSLVSLYAPDNSISKTVVVTRFPNYQSLPDWMKNYPKLVFRQFDIPFEEWIPVNINVSQWFSAAEQTSFPLTRIGLESSNSSGLYYDDVKIVIS